jgi:hypothetical protein
MTLLLSVTLAYVGGLLAGLRQPLPASGLALLGVVAVLMLHARKRRVAAVVFIIAGLTTGSVRAGGVARDCREQIRDGRTVQLSGVPLVVPTDGVTLPVHVRVLAAGDITCSDVVVRVRA